MRLMLSYFLAWDFFVVVVVVVVVVEGKKGPRACLEINLEEEF